MKKNHNSLFAGIAITLLTLAGCGDDDESNRETTVDEDKANIETTFDEALNCIKVLRDGPAMNVLLREFLSLSDGQAFNNDWIDDLTLELEDVLDLHQVEDNQRFDIGFYAGTYTYNSVFGWWTKTNDQDNRVVFEFPSTPQEAMNNAVMVIENYSDTQVQIESETYYLPNTANVNVTVDGTEIFRLTLRDVDYDSNNDFEIPVAVDMEIFMNPFTLSITIDRNTTTDFVLDIDFTNDAGCDWGIDAEVQLDTDDFENLSEDDIESITATLRINDLSIRSLSGIADLLKADDPSDTEINRLLDLEVLFNNVKIGDLEYNSENETVIIFYKDRTSEDSAVYYDDFLDELEALLVEFTGEWD